MIVVDSSVWIDYFNGHETRETDALDRLLGSDLVVIGDLILVEVLQGFRTERDVRRARQAMDALVFEPMIGRTIALASAANYRRLRARGLTVRKTIDVIIATFCVERGHALLHADRDFTVMADALGLSTV
ncbi:MAG: type II toxin-antitoxin system VapC family toxin [Inquilinaceae bacterium]